MTRTFDRAPEVPAEPPALAPDVQVHAPIAEGEPWFVQRGINHYFKIAPDLARLLTHLDGRTPRDELVMRLGAPWQRHDVDQALATLATARLLLDSAGVARRSGRLRFVPPLTVQLTLVDPSRLLARVARRTTVASGSAAAGWTAAVALSGLVALVLRGEQLAGVLGSPLSYATVLGVFLGILLTTALHEVGHGLVLASYGGRPRRMGVMLFYLTPAFFCDVSDGWRLRVPLQRVHVAVAGILVQAALASGYAWLSLLPLPDVVCDGLLVLSVVTYLACLMNALPFVKLDGYVALMSWLDIPHLRDKAMADARAVLSGALLGVAAPRQLPDRPWAPPLGFACLLFPVFLVVNALNLWSESLLRLGVIGSVVMVVVVGAVALALVRESSALVREAVRNGARHARIGVVGALAAVLAVGALALVPVPRTVAGGYTISADGSAELVLPTSADVDVVVPGATVELAHTGLVLSTHVGTATVGAGGPESAQRPFSTLFPLTDDEPLIPVTVLPLDVGDLATGVDRGEAQVRLGDVPLGEWLVSLVAGPFG